jgi:hypothetical protein
LHVNPMGMGVAVRGPAEGRRAGGSPARHGHEGPRKNPAEAGYRREAGGSQSLADCM